MRRKLFLFAVILTVTVFLITSFFPDLWVPGKASEDKDTVSHAGVILSVREKEKGSVLIVKDPGGFKVRLQYYGNDPDLWAKTGKTISYTTKLSYGDPARNPHCFDFRKYIRSSGLFLTGNISSFDVCDDRAGSDLKYALLLAGIRHSFEKKLPESSRGMIMGMLFGDTAGIEEETKEDFRRNGTAHVLAVSGLHVGLLYSIYEKLSGNRRSVSGMVFLAFLLYTYGTLTMWSPSVFRAELMIALKNAAKIKELRYDSLTAMSLAAVILILSNPYVIYGTGFQMSFLAITSIDVLGKRLPEKIPETLRQAISVNLSLTLYQAYVFNYVSPFSVLINIPVIYASGIAIPLSFMTFGFFAVSSLAGRGIMMPLLYIPASSVTEMIIWINTFLTFGGRSSFDVVRPPSSIIIMAICVVLFLCSEYAGIVNIRKDRKNRNAVMILIISFALVSGIILYEPLGSDEIVFVDVGQGACTHVRSNGINVLIDGGGHRDKNIGKTVLKPYLIKNGVKRIDTSLATHEDSDHIKGLYELEECYRSPAPSSRSLSGDIINLSEDVYIETVWPVDVKDDKQGNEESSVFIIYYGGCKVMVTGDLDMEGEKKMIDYYRSKGSEAKLRADVLNIGHHGSNGSTSDELLDTVLPDIAVIQVGKNNYGHPGKETLERLNCRGIMVFRNDEMGAVGLDLARVKGRTVIKNIHVMIESPDKGAAND